MGVQLKNFAWFVFDSGLPEAAEVTHLINIQQVTPSLACMRVRTELSYLAQSVATHLVGRG